jgi:hypothetical protein
MVDGRVFTTLFGRTLLAGFALAVAGCDGGSEGDAKGRGEPPGARSYAPAQRWHDGELPALRFRLDAARNRLWILDRAGVDVFDVTERHRERRVALPGWLWVDQPYGCAPDLVLEPTGAALVSSNVVPALWRIDADTFAVTRHDLALDADADKDVGFTGLAFVDRDVLLAVSGIHGSLWRVDPRLSTAAKIALTRPVHGACGLAIRPPDGVGEPQVLCVPRAGKALQVSVSPDCRRGYVADGPC